jgi:hypothetical protein
MLYREDHPMTRCRAATGDADDARADLQTGPGSPGGVLR